jgi:hypothetical protein
VARPVLPTKPTCPWLTRCPRLTSILDMCRYCVEKFRCVLLLQNFRFKTALLYNSTCRSGMECLEVLHNPFLCGFPAVLYRMKSTRRKPRRNSTEFYRWLQKEIFKCFALLVIIIYFTWCGILNKRKSINNFSLFKKSFFSSLRHHTRYHWWIAP